MAVNEREDKILIVEGKKDLFVVSEFMEMSDIVWQKKNPPVFIKDSGGNTEIPKIIQQFLKTERLERLGIMQDADEDAEAVWSSIYTTCKIEFPNLPKELPPDGHWIGEHNGRKLGIWIMPGNKQKGMLEDFLAECMIHDPTDELWEFAKTSTVAAKSIGAKYKDVHKTKAQLYCWLSWHKSPDDQIHQNMEGKFNPKLGLGPNFKKWFCDLYDPLMKTVH